MTKLNISQGDPYVPVECGLHSAYELAIMHQNFLHLAWSALDAKHHKEKVMPLDLKTINHEEYLIVKTNNRELHQIRLDKILHSDVDEVINA